MSLSPDKQREGRYLILKRKDERYKDRYIKESWTFKGGAGPSDMMIQKKSICRKRKMNTGNCGMNQEKRAITAGAVNMSDYSSLSFASL